MQPIIVASKDFEKRSEKINQLTGELKINVFDVETIETESSVGIELVREIQKKIFLTPLKGDKKAVIIPHAETITVEAQNALLKLLEEPPLSTLIILGVSNKDLLLPTVISRCKIISLDSGGVELTEEELTDSLEQLEKILEAGVGERLAFAETQSKTRDEAAKLLERLIIAARSKLVEDPENEQHLVEVIKKLQKTLVSVKTTNASTRLTLEACFLSF